MSWPGGTDGEVDGGDEKTIIVFNLFTKQSPLIFHAYKNNECSCTSGENMKKMKSSRFSVIDFIKSFTESSRTAEQIDLMKGVWLLVPSYELADFKFKQFWRELVTWIEQRFNLNI